MRMTASDIRASWRKLKQQYPTLTPWQHAQIHCQIPYREYAATLGIDKLELSRAGGLFPSYDLGKPWELDGDWMIAGDVHVPFARWDYCMNLAQVAKKAGIKRLLIDGDFLNLDMFSTYAQVVESPSWAQERDAARMVVHAWLETFDEIKMLMGNHDRRVQKFTQGAFEESDILALIVSNPERVRMSNFGHCVIHSGGVPWRITHPKNYSVNNLVVAEQLAMKFGMNVMSAHEHHLAIGYSRYGNHIIVNIGCLVDDTKLDYVALDDSKGGAMVPGFVMLRDGTPTLFGEAPFTDWRLWL